jgi:hypothetical protein
MMAIFSLGCFNSAMLASLTTLFQNILATLKFSFRSFFNDTATLNVKKVSLKSFVIYDSLQIKMTKIKATSSHILCQLSKKFKFFVHKKLQTKRQCQTSTENSLQSP